MVLDIDKCAEARKSRSAETWSEMLKRWPFSTLTIAASGFFMMMSDFGAILPLYMLNKLNFTEPQTVIIYNVQTAFVSILSIIGAILADSFIGRYKTVMLGTMLYSVGKIVLAGVSVFPNGSQYHPWVDAAAFFTIATASGLFGSSNAPFCGDQFPAHETRMRSTFFSISYGMANVGLMLSAFTLPILRTRSCFGEDNCYPLPFTIAATCMAIATIILISGSKWYQKMPPTGNIVILDVCRVIKIAFANKLRARRRLKRRRERSTDDEVERNKLVVEQRDHWLDHYLDTHQCAEDPKCVRLQQRRGETNCFKAKFIADVKSLLRIMVMFVPLPIFWALYHQQYSVWVVQSLQMDCRLWGNVLLLPDQKEVINPGLIVLLIILLEFAVFPLVQKCRISITPLRKMVAGGVMAAIAFLVSSAVQVKINAGLPELPNEHTAFVSFVNTLDCPLTVSLKTDSARLSDTGVVNNAGVELAANSSLENSKLTGRDQMFWVPSGTHARWRLDYGADCSRGIENQSRMLEYDEIVGGKVYAVILTPSGVFLLETNTKKPTGGNEEFALTLTLALSDIANFTENVALCRRLPGRPISGLCDPAIEENFYVFEPTATEKLKPLVDLTDTDAKAHNVTVFGYKPMRTGRWRLFFLDHVNGTVSDYKGVAMGDLNATDTGIDLDVDGQGSVLVVTLTGSAKNPEKRGVFRVMPENHVWILWQIPQIALITAAEILFSVTALEFTYSQAATSMKSLVAALYGLTDVVGNFIIVAVTLVNFWDSASQHLFYAGAMFVVIFVFALLAIFYYEYVDYSSAEDDDMDDKEAALQYSFREKTHGKDKKCLKRHNEEEFEQLPMTTFLN